MKIKSIEIKNIRGIRELNITPNGRNVVIWGPNGSGKSALVDAIDFLMTGEMHRLMGEGTAGTSLAKHGPHIDYSSHPDQTIVRANIIIEGAEESAYISRSIQEPDNLILEGVSSEQISASIDMARLRQHTLSRREILRYIAEQAGKRSAEIQSLLNLSILESIRLSSNRVKKEAKDSVKSVINNVKSAETDVATCLSLDNFDLVGIKEKVNKLRQALGSSKLADITSLTVKSHVSPPHGSDSKSSPNPKLIKDHNEALIRLTSETNKIIEDNKPSLLAEIELIHSDEHARRKAESLSLLKMGDKLLDDTGVCPLCGFKWEEDKLKNIIKDQITSASEIKKTLESIGVSTIAISQSLTKLKSRIEIIQTAANQLKLNESIKFLSEKIQILHDYIDACENPLEKLLELKTLVSKGLFLSNDPTINNHLNLILTKAKHQAPTLSPEQGAWDVLTALTAKLETLEKASESLVVANLYKDRADAFFEAFFAIRDAELDKLYDLIKNRFVELYRYMHGEDENKFDAKLKPDGKFEVDFYDRGKHPPVALHSEGHQDSMGVCLFLALSEYLTSGKLGLVVLDDVVMSVDAEHRRKFCRLLNKHFSGKQFFITTHDRTWARQLQLEGVVKRDNSVEFARWNILDGPSVLIEGNIWDQIDGYLDKNDIPSASFRLRNGSERFFETACDNLMGRVIYKSSGRYTLEDFMSGAIGALKQHYRAAKNAASSWGNVKRVEEISEEESVITQIIMRTNLEKWGVNSSVHYNNWHVLQKGDFKPIVEAFHDCFNLFICNECGTTIRVNLQEMTIEAIRCDCQKINLNLVKK